ncbi:MAG: ABC transporter substrate-binding protein [Patescibacteria group bacterium]|nr:ABC transporter substrate-binding protein [Patescibacteria group bacterium]
MGISDQLDTLVQLNTHEGLVGFDEYMQIQPRIAKSWGSLDDTTWQFILRPGVLFHDGSLLTMQDVVLSIQASTLAQDLILTQKNETHLQIQTQTPDNLLLFKLTSIPISQRITGVGTGPFYQNTSDQQVVLSRFDQYWGDAGVFARVVLHQIEDKFERTQQFLDGDLDVLIGIPPEILGLPDNLKTDFQLIAKG